MILTFQSWLSSAGRQDRLLTCRVVYRVRGQVEAQPCRKWGHAAIGLGAVLEAKGMVVSAYKTCSK